MIRNLNEMDYKMLNYYLRGYRDIQKSGYMITLQQGSDLLLVQSQPYGVSKLEKNEKERIAHTRFMVNGSIDKRVKVRPADTYKEMFYDSLMALAVLSFGEIAGVYNNFLACVATSAYFQERGLNLIGLNSFEKLQEAEIQLVGAETNSGEERFARFASPFIRDRFLNAESDDDDIDSDID